MSIRQTDGPIAGTIKSSDMTIEKYYKSKKGKPFYNIFHCIGKTTRIEVCDILAKDENEALAKAKVYIEDFLKELNF